MTILPLFYFYFCCNRCASAGSILYDAYPQKNILNVCRAETREGLAEGDGWFIYGEKTSAAGITGRAYQGLS